MRIVGAGFGLGEIRIFQLGLDWSNSSGKVEASFADDPQHIYLLMVDLEEHPLVDIHDPKTIDPSWVSKFHIPTKK